ncbi:MAG TPA: zinc-dependent metalloprotease family protein [Ferruginibacter sp.]|nr:zinc-dependent metalloprotease family protein [Ferruginibacter sp.]
MKKTLPLTLLLAIITTLAFGQSDQFWSPNYSSRASMVTDKAVARLSFPKEFKLFNLNIEPLRRELFAIVDQSAKRTAIISLPNADGKIEQFEVYEASNFDPRLQARFPEIRAFSGKGITDRTAYLKLSISPQGIQTMIFRTETQNEFIEPYSVDHTVYAVFKSQRDKGKLPWACSTEEKQYSSDLQKQIAPSSNIVGSSAGELKTMRLAQSCNGEYANFFGATNSGQVALVLAAFNNTLTRCNGCYEKDLALHLNLVPETVNVIYYNPATDPYTSLGNWNTELQIALNTTLTGPGTPINVNNAAYDIGHMFGASGGGGNAGCIGCVCVDGVPSGTGATKGRGITSPADGIPQGDNFDIDYVAHEVGHQLGGNHTFTHSNEGTVAQREVGAGITIMGYAGITSFDPAPHSIDIFHAASIDQIQNNLATKTCPITTNITATNHTPVVAPLTPYTIPISTPFALTGSATDADPGDALTYCWEQYDLHGGQTGSNSVAYATKPVGPNYLTFPAVSGSTRYFPRLSTVQAGLLITPTLPGGDAICNIEALSSVSRTLNFRLTVRDNRPYVPVSPGPAAVGQTAYADVAITVTNTAGPFKVTAPNTNVTWNSGTSQTITWDVNNTNTGSVNCANVKISLSTDGGNTFPTVILASTANDGTETITVPSIATTTARIKVEAVGNIFYDMSDVNFTIVASNPTFEFVPNAGTAVACGSASAAITLQTTSVLGFSTPINLAATAGVPAGTNVTFSVNPVTPGNSTVVTLNNMTILGPGTYNITIQGTAGAEVKTIVLAYTVNPGTGPSITGQPTSTTICSGTNTTFTVTSAAATSFQWQESTNGGGTWANVVNGGIYGGATTATLSLTGVTAGMNGYQYRCIASVLCGSSTSGTATLTVNAAPSISAQPVPSVVCGATSTTFSVTAAGAGITYQWQSATSCAGPWTNLANGAPYSGVTTATLTVNPTSVAMSGTVYRCVISGTCAPAVNSTCVALTVNTPIAITSQPSNVTLCAGLQTSFTVAATGTTPSYQWQESTNGGGTWTNITNAGVYSGATTATLTLTGVTAGMSGYQYRCVVNGATSCAASNSTAATLTVNTAPSITTQPVAATTLCAGNNVTYTVAANGTAPTYQWQISTTGAGGPWTNITNGGVYSGATTASLTITGVTVPMNGSLYRCVVSGTCTPAATSNNAALTVNTPISITTQPAATTNVCATGSTSFTVAAAGTTPGYQWQLSTNGGTTWTNITNGGVYGGATTTTLTLTGITAAMTGSQYRCVVSGAAPCAAVNSGVATLNVTPQPVITAAPYTALMAGWTTTLTVNVTPAPGLSFAWFLNGTLQAETGNTLIANVNRLGDYRVVVTGPAGNCTSELLTIRDSASKKLFIYPVPNNGRFTVTYHVPGASVSNATKQSIVIYNSDGKRVFNREFTVTQPYQLHNIDLRGYAGGVYYVVLREANGNKIKTGEVVIK